MKKQSKAPASWEVKRAKIVSSTVLCAIVGAAEPGNMVRAKLHTTKLVAHRRRPGNDPSVFAPYPANDLPSPQLS